MPELPEVETTARGLRLRLVGRKVRGVEVGWARSLANLPPEAAESFLVGRRIEAVGRRGKLVLLHLDDGAALAIHRRMSGNLLVEGDAEPRHRHTRFVLRLDRGLELRFVDARKFGRLFYFADDSALREYLSRAVGAEPLEGLGAERLAALLGGRRGRLKAVLLDQRVLAGIGNIYADEILWRARLHPGRSAAGLEPGELQRLAEAIDTVLRSAIERRGTSLSDYRDAEGEPGENQAFLEAYGRAGRPCSRCGTPIAKYRLGQRGTHLCPSCQVAPPS